MEQLKLNIDLNTTQKLDSFVEDPVLIDGRKWKNKYLNSHLERNKSILSRDADYHDWSLPFSPAADRVLCVLNIVIIYSGDLRMSEQTKFPDCYMKGFATMERGFKEITGPLW